MKVRHILSFALLLCTLTGFAQSRVSADALGAVQYDIRYKLGALNTKVADGTITLENSTWNGQSVLHSHADIQAKSVFKLFMNAAYIVDLYLTRTEVEPVYYINPFKKNGQDGKVEFTYDRSGRKIDFVAVRPPAAPVSDTFPLDGKTMDLLSTLQYARFLNLSEGSSMSLKLLKSGKVIPATLTFIGKDMDRFPGREAERLQLTMTGGGLMENGSGSIITVWRSAGSDRRILGLEVALSSGTMIVTSRQ